MKRNNGLLLLSALLFLTALTSCQEGNAQNEEPTVPPVVGPTDNDKLKQYDIVRFGNYQQNNEGKTPIEWVVLATEDDKTLLLSRNLLSSRPWDVTGRNLTYDRSSIRQWLNGEFLAAAFSAAEAEDIVPTNLDNSDQQGYGTPAGEKTIDKVFLLSIREFDTYVKGSTFVTSAPTDFAKREGAYANDRGNAAWWLRSPGAQVNSPAYLYSGGTLGTRAHGATENIIGIRPAIWVRIKSK